MSVCVCVPVDWRKTKGSTNENVSRLTKAMSWYFIKEQSSAATDSCF